MMISKNKALIFNFSKKKKKKSKKSERIEIFVIKICKLYIFEMKYWKYSSSFFSVLVLLFSKPLSTLIFRSAVAFQQYQIYQVF